MQGGACVEEGSSPPLPCDPSQAGAGERLPTPGAAAVGQGGDPWDVPKWCRVPPFEAPPSRTQAKATGRAAAVAAAQAAMRAGLSSPGVPPPELEAPRGLEATLAAHPRLGSLARTLERVLELPPVEPPPPEPARPLTPELQRLEQYGQELAERPPAPPDTYAAPQPKPPQLTRSQRRQVAKEKQAARALKRRNAYIDKMKAKGISEDACPPECPLPLYQLAQSILCDHHGRRTVGILEEEARQRSGFHLGLLRDVLKGKLDLRSYRDRELVATFVLLYRLGRRVQRKDGWCLLVQGYSLSWLAGVLHTPGKPEERRHRSQLGGGGRKHEAQRTAAYAQRWGDGYARKRNVTNRAPVLQRLRDGGVLYAQQVSWEDAAPFERDTRGETDPKRKHTRNRYWLQGLSLQTLRRERSKTSPVHVKTAQIFDAHLARFQALEAYGQEWVTALRHALERRHEAQPQAPE